MHLPKSTDGTTPRVKLNICYGLGPNVSYRLWCISVNSSVLTNVPVWWKMFLMRMALCVSVQFSRSVMSDSLRPHESQHARPPCPSPTPRVTQTHAHRVGDAIQPSHPLSSPFPPAPNPSQHQGLLQWVNSSHEVAKVLEFQLQHQSFQWTPRTDLL